MNRAERCGNRRVPRAKRTLALSHFRTLALFVALLLTPTACGQQRILDPRGPQAAEIAGLGILLMIVGGTAFVVTMAALGMAAMRGRRRARTDEPADTRPETERRMARNVAVAGAATAAVLLLYVAASAMTGRAISWTDREIRDPLVIRVVARQWWWDFQYVDHRADHVLYTANEIHIPVGRPVKIIGESRDVIHSFWVPNLHGKQDLLPRFTNVTWLRADQPGSYRGQCGEFCGFQHARMAFWVTAVPPAEFEAWYRRQLAIPPAPTPADSGAFRGKQVFLTRGCVMCHRVAGTPAGSRLGPELTHLASRQWIAAGTLRNTRGNLAGWIVDPQRIKPGVRMPANDLSPGELHDLLDYLGTLR